MMPVAISLGLLAGYMEYRKYKIDSFNSGKRHYIDTSQLKYKIIFTGINEGLGLLSLNTVIDYFSITVFAKPPMPWIYNIASASTLATLSGVVEYFDRKESDSSKIKKVMYAGGEFLRPTLCNWYASIFFLFALIYMIVPHSEYSNYLSLLRPVALFIPLLNIVRAQDSYSFRFAKTELVICETQTASLISRDTNSQNSYGVGCESFCPSWRNWLWSTRTKGTENKTSQQQVSLH